MQKFRIYHPFFFAIFPILFLYAQNMHEVSITQVFFPVLISLGCTIGLSFFLTFIFSAQKSALVVSSFLFVFFSYGHIFKLITGLVREQRWLSGYTILPTLFFILFVFWFFVLNKNRILKPLTYFFNYCGLTLTLISLSIILSQSVLSIPIYSPVKKSDFKNTTATIDNSQLPDIYYIIFDRYASSKSLKKYYGIDNQDFILSLEEKGFYVAADSLSNYLKTGHSLASSLNFEYLLYMSDLYGKDSQNFLPLYEKLEDYQLWRRLSEKGYQFIHFGSFWQHTSYNSFAYKNYNLYPLPEFSMLLYKTTVLYPFGVRFFEFDEKYLQWKRVRYSFTELKQIPQNTLPTFVFAHFIIPHDPFVFNADGSYKSPEVAAQKTYAENLTDQIVYLNGQIIELVAQLLAASKKPPIIIIQGDEGSFPKRYMLQNGSGDETFDWKTATVDELWQKMSILNAYYFPSEITEHLYPTITPVNTFRLLWKWYFHEPIDLLPDEQYIFANDLKPYDFYRVTDTLNMLH